MDSDCCHSWHVVIVSGSRRELSQVVVSAAVVDVRMDAAAIAAVRNLMVEISSG